MVLLFRAPYLNVKNENQTKAEKHSYPELYLLFLYGCFIHVSSQEIE